ncbi:MAG: glycosyltransferase family 39 protein [Planctomycetaceae bacterium]|nr:glycosyltransferase family 39 protein [Planctomycetaceae bacterium]
MAGSLKRFIPQSDKQAFWLSFFLCLFFCAVILFVVAPITGLSRDFSAGNDGYIQIARNLVAGNGYVFEKGGPPVFHRPPMYPLFLVPVAIFPESLQRYIIVIPQSILVGFIGMLIFKIARQLYNQNIAVIALLLFLINPWVYWNAKNPMTAILQTFLYIVFVYFAGIELFNKSRVSQLLSAIFMGISAAALILAHAAMLPVVFVVMLIIFAAGIKRNKRIMTAVYAGLIAICLIVPWTYRNWIAFHKFIPVAGGGGLAYFNGNVHWDFIEDQPQQKGETYIDASLRLMGIDGNEATLTHWKGFKDIKNEEIANAKMAEDIKTRPVLFLKKNILNAIEYYFPMLTYPFLSIKVKSTEQTALTVFHLGLWICAVFGFYFYRRTGLLLLAMIICYAVWYFPFATFIGHSLYTLGTIPFLSILAAAGVARFARLIP